MMARSAFLLIAGLLAVQPRTPVSICRVSGVPTEHGYQAGQIATCDLDGDGAVDPATVLFECEPGESCNRFRLVVEGASVAGDGENFDSTFAVMDVDTSDRQLEIAIPASGPSDDYSTRFFAWRAGRMVSLGELPGSYELHADGSGVVRTSIRGEVLCTWFHDAEFRLGDSGTFERIPRTSYSMNVRVAMKRELTLPGPPGHDAARVRFRKGEEVALTSSDDRSWVMVMNRSGAMGYCTIDSTGRLTAAGLEPTDVFDGLPMAD